jgi:hypothetical protein
MIIHHRETTDGHRKDLRKLFKPFLKPLLAVVISLTEQERATHAARDAVVPAGQRNINELGASDRHKRTPDGAYALLHVSTVVSSRPICDHVFKNHRVRRSGRHSQNGHAEKRGWPALHVLATLRCMSLRPFGVPGVIRRMATLKSGDGLRCMSLRPQENDYVRLNRAGLLG